MSKNPLKALYNYTRQRMLNAHRFRNLSFHSLSMTSSSDSDTDLDEMTSDSITDVDTHLMKLEEALTAPVSEDDEVIICPMSKEELLKNQCQMSNCATKISLLKLAASTITSATDLTKFALNARNSCGDGNKPTANRVTSMPALGAVNSCNSNLKLPNNVKESGSQTQQKLVDSNSEDVISLREKLMNFKLNILERRRQECAHNKSKMLDVPTLGMTNVNIKKANTVSFKGVEYFEVSEGDMSAASSALYMDTDEDYCEKDIKQGIKNSKKNKPVRIHLTRPSRVVVTQKMPIVPKLQDFSSNINAAPKTRNSKPQRRNASFTNMQLREIERVNKILLNKIVSQKSTFVRTGEFSKFPIQVASTASINRRKQQRQIDLNNKILKSKIEAIAVRKPLIKCKLK